MLKFIILNHEVSRYLISNPQVFPVFYTLHQGYDDEIQPLHNKDWVSNAKLEEKIILDRAIELLNNANNAFKLLSERQG